MAENDPMDKVLNTVELLELILGNLPLKDRLLAKRVSTHWKEIIESKAFSKAMFNAPIGPTKAWVFPTDPSVRQYSPEHFQRQIEIVDEISTYEKDKGLSSNISAHRCIEGTFNDLFLEPGYWVPLDLANRAMNGEGARVINPRTPISESGRNMFATQPPCSLMMFHSDWQRQEYIYNPDGLRLGDILDKIESVPQVPYLSQVYVRIKGFICPTESDLKEVGEVIRRKDEDLKGGMGLDGAEAVPS